MIATRLAQALLGLFPRAFRDEYGPDVVQLFAEQWRDAGALRPGRRAALLFDLVTSAGREWRAAQARPDARRSSPGRLDVLLLDLKHQVRWLARTPAFAVSALVTLALGVGVTTAIFAVFHGVLLRPLPFPEPERLAFITRTGDVSIPDGVDWRARSRSWESIALFARSWNFDLTGLGEPESITNWAVDGQFFRVLRLEPVLGRRLEPDDDRPGGPHVAVLSEKFWRTRFAADPAVIGRSLTLGGIPTTIVGVAPRSADFLDDGAAVFTPIAVIAPGFVPERGTNNLDAIGRIKPGVAFETARRELVSISTALSEEYPRTNRGKVVDPLPLATFLTGDVRPALVVVLSAVVALLLIATVNLAGLLLARVTARRRELAVRSALGAAAGRITRQLVVEGLVLGAAGGAGGLLVARLSLGILRQTLPESVPRAGTLTLSGPVLLFALAVAVQSGLLCGIVPALSSRHRADLNSARGSSERGRPQALRVVVATEIALATVLLAAAGIVIKSFERLWHQPLGFDPQGLLSADVVLPDSRFVSRDLQSRTYSAIVDRLASTPGVLHAAYITTLPLYRPGGIGNAVLLQGVDVPPKSPTGARVRPVYGDYFRTMRIDIVAGRPLTEADRDGSAPVAVVNQTFARSFFDGADPIGRRIALRDWHELTPGPVWMTIVGVANDIRALSLADGDEPAIYLPYLQRQMSWVRFGSVVVRTAGDPTAFVPRLKQAVWAVDGLLAPAHIETLEQRRSGSAARERFLAVVLSLFAGSALLLVVQGLWGVVAYTVAERRREIGVRVALGAARFDVVGLVTRESLLPLALGAIAGTAVAIAASRLLRQAVFQVSPTDPTVLGATVAGLLAVALLASAVPAWRATRIDPIEVMKAD